MTFKALLANKDGEKISTDLVELEEKDLMRGDVTIAVDYSTVNYKDGLALTGRAPIIRTFPLIPGIDLSGTVQASAYSGIEVGDRVVPMAGVSVRHITVATRRKLGCEETGSSRFRRRSQAGMPWLSERQVTRQCCRCWLSNMAVLLPTVAKSLSRAPVAASDCDHTTIGTRLPCCGFNRPSQRGRLSSQAWRSRCH